MLFLGETGLTHAFFLNSHLGLSRSLRPKAADFEAEKNFTKKNNLVFQLCFPCYGIFPARNTLKLTFVFFQLQLYGYYIAHCRG